MKYRLRISPIAFSDIRSGVAYYNQQQKGLGKRFKSIIKATLDDVQKMPLSASIVYDDVRYKVVNKFPYIILYRIKNDIVFVSRIFNTHQNPVY